MPKRGRANDSMANQQGQKKMRKTENNGRDITFYDGSRRSDTVFRAIATPVAGSIIYRNPRVPRISSTERSTTVRNTELVVNLTLAAAGAFSLNVQPLIPAAASWLATVADLYSKWRWKKCSLIYIPKCPTSTSGSVAMAIVYDSQDVVPTSRIQVSQCYQSITFPPYAGYGGASALNSQSSGGEALVSTLDTNRLDKPWYSTIGLAQFNSLTPVDRNQFCPATVLMVSDGGPLTATPAGDVFLRYEIEFIEPINPTFNV